MSMNLDFDMTDIAFVDRTAMIGIYVRSNCSPASVKIFEEYVYENTDSLDDEKQKWTIAEAALGAAVVNESVMISLVEYLANHTTPELPHEHDKVWSLSFLASNPPQYQWICRFCGEQGRTRTNPGEGSAEYDALVNRHIKHPNYK